MRGLFGRGGGDLAHQRECVEPGEADIDLVKLGPGPIDREAQQSARRPIAAEIVTGADDPLRSPVAADRDDRDAIEPRLVDQQPPAGGHVAQPRKPVHPQPEPPVVIIGRRDGRPAGEAHPGDHRVRRRRAGRRAGYAQGAA